jgi:hypothetical protein
VRCENRNKGYWFSHGDGEGALTVGFPGNDDGQALAAPGPHTHIVVRNFHRLPVQRPGGGLGWTGPLATSALRPVVNIDQTVVEPAFAEKLKPQGDLAGEIGISAVRGVRLFLVFNNVEFSEVGGCLLRSVLMPG